MKTYSDLHNNSKSALAFEIQVLGGNGTVEGEIIDTAKCNILEFVGVSGTITDGVHNAVVYQGDDAALADAELVTSDYLLGSMSFILTDDNVTKRMGFIGKKRYCRLDMVSTGVTSGGTLGAVAIQAGCMHNPQA